MPTQTRSNCGGFESLLELSLNQRTVIQCDVFVIFRHATFFHEKMLHLGLERALCLGRPLLVKIQIVDTSKSPQARINTGFAGDAF